LNNAAFVSSKLQNAQFGCAKTGNDTVRGFDGCAQLQRAILLNAQLQGANLQYAQLQDADLRGAELQGANLFGAQLQRATLQNAQLQGANLQHAQLEEAQNLTSTQLQGANLACSRESTPYVARGLFGNGRLKDVETRLTVANRMTKGKFDPAACPGVVRFNDEDWAFIDRLRRRANPEAKK
jgi:Pentapeptide repeats (8 copies)